MYKVLFALVFAFFIIFLLTLEIRTDFKIYVNAFQMIDEQNYTLLTAIRDNIFYIFFKHLYIHSYFLTLLE